MKMYIFKFQQATIFTATLLFQPQLLTMYIPQLLVCLFVGFFLLMFFGLLVAAAFKFQYLKILTFSRNSEIISHNSDMKNQLVIISDNAYIPHF